MMGALPDGPFVLLDDARAEGAAPARLYRAPVRIIEASTPAQVRPALDQLAGAAREGLHAAGFIAYEAGLALEPKLAGIQRDPGLPLLWFGLFGRYTKIAPDEVAALLPPPESGWVGKPRPDIARAGYDIALGRVKALIEAGDIYQANLTFGCTVPVAGHPAAMYAGLRHRARAGYGGLIRTGADWLLSLSPELFFAAQHGKLTAKPMKGTAERILPASHAGRGTIPQGGMVEGYSRSYPSTIGFANGPPPQVGLGEDRAAIEALRSDPKQRAENLMIVDLLRNDLSRVAEPGSVEVPHLFAVETYPTVHQMTSTVTARLKPGVGAAETVAAIFPCGSITGAPKIRAMEVIAEVEPAPRGIYTGSIGRIDANGDAAFNVAIRTLHLRDGASMARLGLGSGIVADSRADEEWAECLAKGRFVPDPRAIDLIETMRFDPEGGIHLLDRHIARIGESARTFGIPFDRHAVRNELQAATFRIAAPRRVRLMLSASGQIAIEISRLHPTPEGRVAVAIMPLPTDPADFRLRHKTADRSVYGTRPEGVFECVFADRQGFLTEGSFTNIFVKGEGALKTPPLTRGLLPGVLRAELLANGSAVEADLRAEDLANGFFIGNASRGLLEAKLRA